MVFRIGVVGHDGWDWAWFVMFVLVWGLYVAILVLHLVGLFELLTACVYEAHSWLFQGNCTKASR